MTATGPTDRQKRLAALGRAAGFPHRVWWLVQALPLVFLLVGIGSLAETALFVARAAGTRGTVVEVVAARGSEGGVSYAPLIAYRDAGGQTRTGTPHISSSEYGYARGDQVDILYDPADPEVVRIDSIFSLYGFGLIFAAVGAVFVILMRGVRRAMFRPGGPLARRLEQAAAEASARQPAPDTAASPAQPRTTDPSQYGHVHEPKPKPAETVRRMR